MEWLVFGKVPHLHYEATITTREPDLIIAELSLFWHQVLTATMKAYLANYHSSIVGLTGTEEQIKQVEETYKVYAAKVDTGTPVYTMAHSSFVFLMSPNDELLEIFRDADPADQMAAKIAERVSAAQ